MRLTKWLIQLCLCFAAIALIVACQQSTSAIPHDNDYGNVNLTMGNPSKATPDPKNAENYLILRSQYALSYSKKRAIPNWASWQLSQSWLGSAKRQNDFRPDPDLPSDWYHVTPKDYTGSGFDRGHMVNSEDRGGTKEDNSSTFLMTNILPQSPDNNQGAWEGLESYCRKLAKEGKELYIVAGGHGTGGTGKNGKKSTIGKGVTVPESVWKVVLVLDKAQGLNENTRTIAVWMPNIQGIKSTPWQSFRKSVDEVEKLTGYDFYSNVPEGIQKVIESKVDNL